jgi:hypothetical protein
MLMQLDSNSHRQQQAAEESKQAPVESDAAMALRMQQEEIQMSRAVQ